MRGNLVVDGRNIYQGTDLAEEGLEYHGLGIPPTAARHH